MNNKPHPEHHLPQLPMGVRILSGAEADTVDL